MAIFKNIKYILLLTENLNGFEYELNNEFPNRNVKKFNTIQEIIKFISNIEFEDTFIIIEDSKYEKFLQEFLNKIKDIHVIPKFIIYSSKTSNLNSNNKSNSYYKYGGIHSSLDTIINFIKKDEIIMCYETSLFKNKPETLDEEIKVSLEPIDIPEKLILPVYFRTMIKIDEQKDNFYEFTQYLYNEYKKDKNIESLLSQIVNIKKIPNELLCKYWARAYTGNLFYYDMNDCLRGGKYDNYILFIKMMYEGVKLKVFESPIKNVLYRGTKLTNNEIKQIKEFISNKLINLPAAIMFSRAFMSFSESENEAVKFALNNSNNFNNQTMTRVLFELRSDEYINQSFNTHADIMNLSFYKYEKEILFFPFTCFEIINITKNVIQNEEVMKIELSYLSHYDSKLRIEKVFEDIKINSKLIKSEFKKAIEKSNIIEKEELNNS